MVRVKYLMNINTGEITSQQVSESEYQANTGGGQSEGEGGGNSGDQTKTVNGNSFAKHGKEWLPAQDLSPVSVRARSKTGSHYSGVDKAYVHRPLMGPIYHSGAQAIIWGSGSGEGWNPGGFDPLKKTIYFNFDEDMQRIFGIMGEYGGRPSTEMPEPGDELGNKLSEKANTEPDGDKEKLVPNASYMDGDGMKTWKLRTNENGHIKDTIRHNPVTNKDDTIPKRNE